MTEIPEDVMKAAVVAFNTAIDMDGYEGSYEVIARAILEERERCENRNRHGACEHVWVGKAGPRLFGFREFNCIKCGLGKQEK